MCCMNKAKTALLACCSCMHAYRKKHHIKLAQRGKCKGQENSNMQHVLNAIAELPSAIPAPPLPAPNDHAQAPLQRPGLLAPQREILPLEYPLYVPPGPAKPPNASSRVFHALILGNAEGGMFKTKSKPKPSHTQDDEAESRRPPFMPFRL